MLPSLPRQLGKNQHDTTATLRRTFALSGRRSRSVEARSSMTAKGRHHPASRDRMRTDRSTAQHRAPPSAERSVHRYRSSLSANMSETVTPWKFSVEGEAGLESDERMGAGPRWVGDRGGGEGDAAAVHGGVQAEDRPGGRRL